MSVFQVDAGAVQQASQAAQRSGENIKTEVASMLSLLHGLESSWQGAAAGAFTEVLTQWQQAQQQVDQALAALSSALSGAASSYAEAEQNVSTLFRR